MSNWIVDSSLSEVVFESDNLKLIWSIDQDAPGIKSISSKQDGFAFDLGCSPLWEINIRDTRGFYKELNGTDLEHFSYEIGEQLVLKWTGLAEGIIDLKLSGTADDERPLIKWRIEVVNHSPDYTIWEIVMPAFNDILGPTGSHDDDRMITSEGFGCSIPQPQKLHKHAVWERFHYPNNIVSMQYCAVQNDQYGFYIGMHDPESLRKDFQYSPPPGLAATGSGNLDFIGTQPVKVIIPPPDSGRNQKKVCFEFDIVTALFEGDWFDAAQIHAKWVQSIPRTALSVSQNQSIPEWAKKLTAWVSCWVCNKTDKIMSAADFQKVFDNLLKFKEKMGVDIGVHIYMWHDDPFDLNYPKYIPKPGFKEFVAKLQAHGMHAMPYINGRLFDLDYEAWQNDQARNFAAKETGAKLNGNAERIFFETYGSKSPMAVMCPGTDYWQDKISDVIVRLAQDLGVDAVYTDQIGAAWPELCADRSHNHKLRNGAWWNQGYYKMLDKVRQKLKGKELYLTTESNADPFTHLLGMLMVNSHRNHIVPAFPAVYGSTALLFGRSENVDNAAAFRIMNFQNVMWGCQPGWFGYQQINKLTSGNYEFEFEAFNNSAKLFGQLQPFVHGGSMLRPPANLAPSNILDIVWQFNGLWPEKVDTIWTAAWQLEDKTITAIANADTHQQFVIIDYFDINPEIWYSEESPCQIEFKDQKACIFLPPGTCITLIS